MLKVVKSFGLLLLLYLGMILAFTVIWYVLTLVLSGCWRILHPLSP